MRLGILVDVETSSVGTGLLMQIFTKPFSSGPAGGGMFFEVIQRVGCGGTNAVGCGGFGKGNFRRLYEGIERREEEVRDGFYGTPIYIISTSVRDVTTTT